MPMYIYYSYIIYVAHSLELLAKMPVEKNIQ